MAVSLDRELSVIGCEMAASEFREAVAEMHAVMYPAWTDEELLFHPDDARHFCGAVRRRISPSLRDDLILRTLVNYRKAHGPVRGGEGDLD